MMANLEDLLNRVNQTRVQQRLTGDRRVNAAQALTGISVQQRVAYTGVVGMVAVLGDRDPATGRYEVTSGDGSIRSAQSIGFGGIAQNTIPPSVVIDGSGGWVDY